MKTLDVHEAAARLPELVDAGAEVILTHDGEPVARLVPVGRGKRPLGFLPIAFEVDLSAPTSADVLWDFEGNHDPRT